MVVLKGKDAGKRGVIQKVLRHQQGWARTTARFGSGWQDNSPLSGAAVVIEGLNIAKRHTKPRQVAGRTERQPRVQQGGILDIPQPIAIANVMLVCPIARARRACVTIARPTAAACGPAHTVVSP